MPGEVGTASRCIPVTPMALPEGFPETQLLHMAGPTSPSVLVLSGPSVPRNGRGLPSCGLCGISG